MVTHIICLQNRKREHFPIVIIINIYFLLEEGRHLNVNLLIKPPTDQMFGSLGIYGWNDLILLCPQGVFFSGRLFIILVVSTWIIHAQPTIQLAIQARRDSLADCEGHHPRAQWMGPSPAWLVILGPSGLGFSTCKIKALTFIQFIPTPKDQAVFNFKKLFHVIVLFILLKQDRDKQVISSLKTK